MSNPANAKSKSGVTGIVRKLISGFTGIIWTIFAIGHLAGNLQLYKTDGTAFNQYGHFLESLGGLLILAEIFLVLFLGMHAISGIQVWLGKRKARPESYKLYQSAGSKSKQSLASRSMIVTGSVLLLFLVVHVLSFKFNIFKPADVITLANGAQARDLYKYVWEAFKNPVYAFGYTFVMALLGLHLRHGVWSALQSLGMMKPKFSPVIYSIGGIIAALVAVGFLSIPLYIYFS
ncbi:succinate dehydrogenase cytochrome b subunit [bacterium]|nr:MAG: succinate dehydrogenase cytochrome b subunit [bacterium]